MRFARIMAFVASALLAASGAQAAGSGCHVTNYVPGPDGAWGDVRIDAPNNRVLLAHGTSVAGGGRRPFAPGAFELLVVSR